MLDKRKFYKDFVILCLPLILQQFVNIALNFIDNLMVGQLGSTSISAVGFANKMFFVFMLCIFGASGGISLFMSQFYGKKDFNMLQKLFALIMIVCVAISIIFYVISYYYAENIMCLFSQDPLVVQIGTSYLEIIAFSFPITGLSMAITFALRSIGHTKQALYITIIATSINTILNYGLIYGNLGFMRLEADGAAIATLIARITEGLLFILLIYVHKYGLITNFSNYFGLNKDFLKKVLKISTPVFFTEMVWVLGTTTLTIAYGKLGTEAAAGIHISDLLLNFGSIVFMGVATATSIMLGHTIGRGSIEKAKKISGEILKVSLVLAVIMVVSSIALIKPIVSLYELSESTRQLTYLTMLVVSISLFFKLMNWTLMIGILRAGGDTKISFIIDTVPLVILAVPVAFLGSMYFHLPIYYVVALANLEEVFKMIVAFWRYKSNKWIHNLTQHEQNI